MKNIKEIILSIFVVVLISLGALVIFMLPKDNTDNKKVNVALVNEDGGYYKSETNYNFGQSFIDLFIEEDSINYEITSRNAALDKLEKNEIDLVLIVPPNYSANLMSYLETVVSNKAQIEYHVSPEDKQTQYLKNQLTALNIEEKVNANLTKSFNMEIMKSFQGMQGKSNDILETQLDYEKEFEDNIIKPVDTNINEVTRIFNEVTSQQASVSSFGSGLNGFEGSLDSNENSNEQQSDNLSDLDSLWLETKEAHSILALDQSSIIDAMNNENVEDYTNEDLTLIEIRKQLGDLSKAFTDDVSISKQIEDIKSLIISYNESNELYKTTLDTFTALRLNEDELNLVTEEFGTNFSYGNVTYAQDLKDKNTDETYQNAVDIVNNYITEASFQELLETQIKSINTSSVLRTKDAYEQQIVEQCKVFLQAGNSTFLNYEIDVQEVTNLNTFCGTATGQPFTTQIDDSNSYTIEVTIGKASDYNYFKIIPNNGEIKSVVTTTGPITLSDNSTYDFVGQKTLTIVVSNSTSELKFIQSDVDGLDLSVPYIIKNTNNYMYNANPSKALVNYDQLNSLLKAYYGHDVSGLINAGNRLKLPSDTDISLENIKSYRTKLTNNFNNKKALIDQFEDSISVIDTLNKDQLARLVVKDMFKLSTKNTEYNDLITTLENNQCSYSLLVTIPDPNESVCVNKNGITLSSLEKSLEDYQDTFIVFTTALDNSNKQLSNWQDVKYNKFITDIQTNKNNFELLFNENNEKQATIHVSLSEQQVAILDEIDGLQVELKNLNSDLTSLNEDASKLGENVKATTVKTTESKNLIVEAQTKFNEITEENEEYVTEFLDTYTASLNGGKDNENFYNNVSKPVDLAINSDQFNLGSLIPYYMITLSGFSALIIGYYFANVRKLKLAQSELEHTSPYQQLNINVIFIGFITLLTSLIIAYIGMGSLELTNANLILWIIFIFLILASLTYSAFTLLWHFKVVGVGIILTFLLAYFLSNGALGLSNTNLKVLSVINKINPLAYYEKLLNNIINDNNFNVLPYLLISILVLALSIGIAYLIQFVVHKYETSKEQ